MQSRQNEIRKEKGIVQELIRLLWCEIRRRRSICTLASSVSSHALVIVIVREVQVILLNRTVYHLRQSHIVKMKIVWMNHSHQGIQCGTLCIVVLILE